MKKIYTILLVLMMSVSAMAQHEIGAVLGGMNGLSYKYWCSNNFALQADLAVGLTRIVGGQYYKGNQLTSGDMGAYDFTINPNVLYHWQLPENFKIYAGGGASFGLVSNINNTDPDGVMGKFGLNAAVGATYDLQEVPLTFALDFRPGYGLGFQKADFPHLSYFDWKLAFAIRYRL